MRKKMIGLAAGAALALSLAPFAAQAVIVEDTAADGLTGDAGSTFATAMDAGGTEVTGISGFLGEGGNDLFRFEFLVPVTFTVSDITPDITLDYSYDGFDIGFGPEGAPVEYCFDCYAPDSGPGSVAIGPVTVGPGIYYLGLADSDEFGGLPLESYAMTVTITELASDVPLPGALALLGGGLAMLGAVRRRRG
ncbi:MAG: hypothetical protein CML46_21940 [Rhodobacteraceae bacterium]|nr:hypothetical protein [Paracoccaceae bacterium]MBR29570.1 hypothetical protein [Paracoccaceae bacterium]